MSPSDNYRLALDEDVIQSIFDKVDDEEDLDLDLFDSYFDEDLEDIS